MGYNLATTILECNEVQLYDYDVKVSMEATEEISENGTVTTHKPKPPYATTNLRKELQRVLYYGERLFHTAVMTSKGPDAGLSRIVFSYTIPQTPPDRINMPSPNELSPTLHALCIIGGSNAAIIPALGIG